jgi:Recombinase
VTRPIIISSRSRGPRDKRAGQAPLLPEAVRLRIAADRAAGRSMNGIAAALNDEAVPTAKGGIWHTSTIRHVLQSIEVDENLAKVRSGLPL